MFDVCLIGAIVGLMSWSLYQAGVIDRLTAQNSELLDRLNQKKVVEPGTKGY